MGVFTMSRYVHVSIKKSTVLKDILNVKCLFQMSTSVDWDFTIVIKKRNAQILTALTTAIVDADSLAMVEHHAFEHATSNACTDIVLVLPITNVFVILVGRTNLVPSRANATIIRHARKTGRDIVINAKIGLKAIHVNIVDEEALGTQLLLQAANHANAMGMVICRLVFVILNRANVSAKITPKVKFQICYYTTLGDSNGFLFLGLGFKCEKCSTNYYGNPKNGGQCYFQCEARGMLKQTGLQGIGSYQSHKNHFGPEARECLWIISPHSATGAQLTDNFIQFEIKTDARFNVTCNENAVYVYDGLPDLIGQSNQRQLLGVFCSEDTKYYMVEARSGYLTVHYKQSFAEQGFNAVYTVRSCAADTCLPPRICNKNGQCTCVEGFTGPDCSIEKCPRNCSEPLNQGTCDKLYGRCLCNKEFGGKDCSVRLRYEKSVIFTELFNSQIVSDNLDHLRKTLPRFGHSLNSDKRGNLWMFAGYSLHHQALNDIRQFDTRNSSWMQVTVDSTPDAKMPQGRYFHGADIQHSKQNIYVFGGLGMSRNNETETVLDDFWKFSLVNQRWSEVDVKRSSIRPPRLAGHTLTLIRDGDHDILVLIGGFSPKNGLSHLTYAFNLSTFQWSTVNATGTAPIGIFGHSAVFHTISQTIYVFGGYVFQDSYRTEMSNKLYALNFAHKIWSEVPIFDGINRVEDNLPRARFLHSAITTDNYMIIYGGRTKPQNSSDLLIAYVYKCNMWVRLTENVDIVGDLPRPTYAQAMSYDSELGAIYVVNGWDGSIESRVTSIRIPSDLCELWSSSKYLCRHFMGCSYCTVKLQDVPISHCYSNERTDICTEGEKQYNKGDLIKTSIFYRNFFLTVTFVHFQEYRAMHRR